MQQPRLSDEQEKELLTIRLSTSARRVAMLAFVRGNPPTAAGVDNNGTASFLELPGGKFIVTNFHVWDYFRAQKEQDSTYKVALTGEGFSNPLDISDAELVSENEPLDLCVLRYPPTDIESLGKAFYPVAPWPPPRAVDGDTVCTTGFPGSRRCLDNRLHPVLNTLVSVLHHESLLLYLKTEGDSDRKVRITFASPTPEIFQISSNPIQEFRWGGMSGSLVYRLDRSDNLFTACGILHAAGEGLGATFYATHLDFIREDGTIVLP